MHDGPNEYPNNKTTFHTWPSAVLYSSATFWTISGQIDFKGCTYTHKEMYIANSYVFEL